MAKTRIGRRKTRERSRTDREERRKRSHLTTNACQQPEEKQHQGTYGGLDFEQDSGDSGWH